MKYEVRYIFSEGDCAEDKIREFSIDDPLDSMAAIEKMQNADDTLYIYNTESGEKIEVAFDENQYFVRDLMANGFYQKKCNFNELLDVLRAFSDPSRNPIDYGMESFG